MKSPLELQGIAKAGASIKMSAKGRSSLELQGIAKSIQAGGSLTITDADTKSPLELQGIAHAGAGKVIFDFTA
ncbi:MULTISPECIES: hypothetical protein [unclassified Gluconobacter]|uniref:hypothetical protein n=1 Tax=unclassified Gluconobacter TaxID=2644261 RepID=UPI001C04BFA7|nr:MULTISPECIES: hypothetical protein [unclassified Gluconobacter]